MIGINNQLSSNKNSTKKMLKTISAPNKIQAKKRLMPLEPAGLVKRD
ncbi:hypothetical protein Q7C_1150 [Methylophaga frappieri]|uniref:Uncharacterized protein n=1 Tax=Methylophaga frappieri (strain ATCC BAA-2434 / DSM 25690 / JAM7) TaxID=754477 RepID=I1YHB2_METFJ|nr:hypothetical protein Q7C_1150 [Methylophaga frappieri]